MSFNKKLKFTLEHKTRERQLFPSLYKQPVIRGGSTSQNQNVPNKVTNFGALGSPVTPLVYSSLRDLGRYNFMIAGHIYLLDLQQLQITDITTGLASTSLTNNGQPIQLSGADQRLKGSVRSVMMFTSDCDTIFTLGANQMFQDHSLIHQFNNIAVSQITIQAPSGVIPGFVDLNFMLSNAPLVEDVYVRDLMCNHTLKTNGPTITVSSFTDILIIHMGCYLQMTAAIAENNVNDVQYQVLVSDDGINWYVLPGQNFPLKISKGSYALFQTTIDWHFYRIQVADNVSGTHGSVSIQASPINST